MQGVGAAVMFAVSLAILANAFPDAKERAGALAAYGATIGGTFALGPLVGGALTSGLDWQWIFLINLPLGAFCLWITRTLRDRVARPARAARRLARPGDARRPACSCSSSASCAATRTAGGARRSSPSLGGAAALLVAFVAIESRVKEPMLPLKLFRNPSFTGAQIAAAAISATFFAVFLYMTLYLQQVLGMSPIEAGLAYLPATVVIFFVSGATSTARREDRRRA